MKDLKKTLETAKKIKYNTNIEHIILPSQEENNCLKMTLVMIRGIINNKTFSDKKKIEIIKDLYTGTEVKKLLKKNK